MSCSSGDCSASLVLSDFHCKSGILGDREIEESAAHGLRKCREDDSMTLKKRTMSIVLDGRSALEAGALLSKGLSALAGALCDARTYTTARAFNH